MRGGIRGPAPSLRGAARSVRAGRAAALPGFESRSGIGASREPKAASGIRGPRPGGVIAVLMQGPVAKGAKVARLGAPACFSETEWNVAPCFRGENGAQAVRWVVLPRPRHQPALLSDRRVGVRIQRVRQVQGETDQGLKKLWS